MKLNYLIQSGSCKHCGNHTEATVKANGPHFSAYCAKCHKWLKHLSKDERKARFVYL